MSEYAKKLREKNALQENRDLGAVFAKCEKLGCSRDFVKSFISRAELLPMKQTLAFLENKDANGENLKRWSTLICTLIEQKPESEKKREWKRCLKVIGDER